MLRETFIHIHGVGPRTEARLWRAGVRTWDEFPDGRGRVRLPANLSSRIEREIARSEEALRRRKYRYFARTLGPREAWRAWPEFRDKVAFLDIETTGLSLGRDAVTVVGVYDGRRKESFIQGMNLEDLPRALADKEMLVTFNGVHFDAPFLRKAFPRMRLDQIHVDLMHPLHRLGFYGGLKSIERRMGIRRSESTAGLGGFDAVRLWHEYRAGDDEALETLVEYNLEDVVNLEPLAEFAHRELRSLYLEGGFVTADRYAVTAPVP